jgi:hydroxymethylbilane synthase
MARFPHLKIESLRGNLQTRLRKLDEGQYAAIILAAAGLKRLGLEARIAGLIDPANSIPAVGQGALGIEIKAGRDDMMTLLAPLNHAETAACVIAERATSRALAGSCQVPLGAFAQVGTGNALQMTGFVASIDGQRMVRAEAQGTTADADALGRDLAAKLVAQGADKILAELEQHA